MAQKCVLYFDGGVMAGIFGAGVAAGLLERNFGNHIEAIYGASAGVFNAAYGLLTKQIPLGHSIYYEDLINDFILPKKIPFGVFQRFCLRYFGVYPGKLRQAVNVDLLMDIVAGKKALDLEKVRSSSTPLYIKIWDVKNGKSLFIDLRTYHNQLQLLKASVSAVPYFLSSESINGFECIDHCRIEINPDIIAARHPNCKIVFIINFNHIDKRGLLLLAARFLEGVVANWCFLELNRMCFMRGVKTYREDVQTIKKNDNMLLVAPPKHISIRSYETDPIKLRKTYEAGKIESKKIVDFISSSVTRPELRSS